MLDSSTLVMPFSATSRTRSGHHRRQLDGSATIAATVVGGAQIQVESTTSISGTTRRVPRRPEPPALARAGPASYRFCRTHGT